MIYGIKMTKKSIIETKTFELPLATFNPTFFWKVRDFFGNENSGSDTQMITLVPPRATLSANTLSPIYSVGSIFLHPNIIKGFPCILVVL